MYRTSRASHKVSIQMVLTDFTNMGTSLLTFSCHSGYHVSRLLQLLISYVKQQFDIVLEDKLLNQVKVWPASRKALADHM